MKKQHRVVRFDFWLDPVYDRLLGEAPHIQAVTCPLVGDDAQGWAELSKALVFQTSGVKDELPRHWFVNDLLLARCPQLLAVSSNGSGCDTIDIEACTRAGIAVLNQAGGNADSVAEMSIGFVIALYRRLFESDKAIRTRRDLVREQLMGHSLGGQTIGLVGVGEIGRKVALLARAFGMEVLGCDPRLSDAELVLRGVKPVSFMDLLKRADVVSLHCPREPSTLGLVGGPEFAAMKRGAFFVSTARGGIHDEDALCAALTAGHLAGAALDVWEVEPPPLDHPLLRLQNVLATFHTAGVTYEARHNNAALAAAQIVDLLGDGRRPPRLVNPEVWPRAQARLHAALDAVPTEA